MKYYDEILDLGIFTRQDIQKIIQNPKTAESFLSRSLIKGYIKINVPIDILNELARAAYSIPSFKYPIKIASNIILSTDTPIFIHILILALPHILR